MPEQTDYPEKNGQSLTNESSIQLQEGEIKIIDFEFFPEKDQSGIIFRAEFIPSNGEMLNYETSN